MSTNLILKMCYFRILPGFILNLEYPFGHLYGMTYLGRFSRINRRAEAVFHLNNIVYVPLNLKEN